MTDTDDYVVTSIRLPRRLVERIDLQAATQRRSRSAQIVTLLEAVTLPGPHTPQTAPPQKTGDGSAGCAHQIVGQGAIAGTRRCLGCDKTQGIDGVWR